MHEKCPTTHLQRLICIAAKCWLLSLASFSEQSTAPQAFLQASCVIFTSCSTCCNLFASAACFRAFCKDFTHGQVQDPQLLGACRMAESISPAMKAALNLSFSSSLQENLAWNAWESWMAASRIRARHLGSKWRSSPATFCRKVVTSISSKENFCNFSKMCISIGHGVRRWHGAHA